MPEQPQGIQLSLEELYQVIGEKEVIRFKLTEEVKKLNEQIAILTAQLSKEKKNG
jgi:hypothetical protein